YTATIACRGIFRNSVIHIEYSNSPRVTEAIDKKLLEVADIIRKNHRPTVDYGDDAFIGQEPANLWRAAKEKVLKRLLVTFLWADHHDLDERPKEIRQSIKTFIETPAAKKNDPLRLTELSAYPQQCLVNRSFVLLVDLYDHCHVRNVAMSEALVQD